MFAFYKIKDKFTFHFCKEQACQISNYADRKNLKYTKKNYLAPLVCRSMDGLNKKNTASLILKCR